MRRINSNNIFLIDGVGALITAFLLTFVLFPNHNFVGVSSQLLSFLSVCAIILAVYSLTCHFLIRPKRPLFLRVLTFLNITYCAMTAALVLILNPETTIFGYVYFISEIAIILALCAIEIKIALPQN